ncbi:MAG: DUF6701 domain-containing protein [Pseudomonadota bacterium]|nr:DUF6701 domain-containing protein [Pseudomonadota bacterium]
MSTRWRVVLSFLLAAMVHTASADVVLEGWQHVGDGTSGSYVPSEPVRRTEMYSYPSRFYLTEAVTVTHVRLNTPIVEESGSTWYLDLYIDGAFRGRRSASGTSSVLVTLSSPLSLSPGVHTIALDPHCINNRYLFSDEPVLCSDWTADEQNDLSFSSITLLTQSGETTSAVNLNRRRHIGDSTDPSGGDYAGRYYPDAPESNTLDISFTIPEDRVFTEIRFYRLRDVAASGYSPGRVLVDGNLVGTLDADADPWTIATSLSLSAGSHTLRVESGMPFSGSDRDDVSWDDIILVGTVSTGGDPGRFNAVEVASSPITGPIFTQVVGDAIVLDIAALTEAGDALKSNYDGTVEIRLLDAGDNSGALDPVTGCRSSWGGQVNVLLASAVFNTSNPLTVSLPAYSNALAEARLQLIGTRDATDPTTDTSCSSDAFAIRPGDFELVATDTDPSTPGASRTLNATTMSATPIHKAGRPFTTTVTARSGGGITTPGYDGTPELQLISSVLGASMGAVNTGAWTTIGGVARSDSVTYSEVGAIQLQAVDTLFASVDAADGTPLARRQIESTPVAVGRFVPDDFSVSYNTPVLSPACGSFTYVGQPFFYLTAPVATVTAVNAFGAITANYTGSLNKISDATVTNRSYTESTLAVDEADLPANDPVVTDNGDGSTALAFADGGGLALIRTVPLVPFDAELSLSADVADGDGVVYTGNPIRFGDATPGAGMAFAGGNQQMRFGQLRLVNAFGSELLPLALAVRVEYFADLGGTTGFVVNGADSCTDGSLAAASEVVLSAAVVGDTTYSQTAVTDVQIVGGLGSVTLAAPNQVGDVAVDWDLLPSYFWLQVDKDGDDSFEENPAARASFGLYGGLNRQIYRRETFP